MIRSVYFSKSKSLDVQSRWIMNLPNPILFQLHIILITRDTDTHTDAHTHRRGGICALTNERLTYLPVFPE